MTTVSLLTVLTAMISLPVSAQEVMPADVSFEASKARLLAEGYYDVHMQDDYQLNLSARDSEGREVFFTVDGITGEIGSPEYDYSKDLDDDITG
jgi:hypothetical protein